MAYVFVRGDRKRGGGVGDIQNLDTEIMDELLPRMESAVNDGTDMLFDKVRELLSRSMPGRAASAPGEAPAQETGELYRSIQKKHASKRAKRRKTGEVFTKLHWATQQEFGGRAGGRGRKKGTLHRIPARPFIRPAVDAVEAAVLQRFEDL